MTYTVTFPAPRVRTDLARLMDDFFGPAAAPATAWSPRASTRELADRWELDLELPGVDPAHLETIAEGTTLTVRGERREEHDEKNANWHRVERHHGTFERQFQLGTAVQGDKVSAHYKDGVLDIRIPKSEAARPKEIPIQVTGS